MAAELLGCHPSMVTQCENGDKRPGRAVAMRMAAQYAIPLAAWDVPANAPAPRNRAAG